MPDPDTETDSRPELFGLYNVDKPLGMTSRQVVNVIGRRARTAKVGHAGTLDPLATGVLIVCVGKATRLVKYVQQMPKEYLASFVLGQQSDTLDFEGEVNDVPHARPPQLADIEAALPQFVGEIQQRPPAYSAIKVRGQRAYKASRAGETVELAPRTVAVHGIELIRYDYPTLTLSIRCGSGTYIRALGRDIAESLGTTAVMCDLSRNAIGKYSLGASSTLDELLGDGLIDRLLSPLTAVCDLPSVHLSAEEVRRISHGQPVERESADAAVELAGVDAAGHLIAVLKRVDETHLRPALSFAAE